VTWEKEKDLKASVLKSARNLDKGYGPTPHKTEKQKEKKNRSDAGGARFQK